MFVSIAVMSAMVVFISATPITSTEPEVSIDKYLSSLNGKTCVDSAIRSVPYDFCVDVCYDMNGVHICYKQCGYGLQQKVEDINDLNVFVSSVNGKVCYPTQSKAHEKSETYVQTYRFCWDVCVVRNGIRVCYKQCN